MTAPDARYVCPCCGYLVFPEPPGSYDICPFCFWEDDQLQLEFATTLAGGANQPTLEEAQRNFKTFGACEERFRGNVKPAPAMQARDPDWRPVDRALDSFVDFDKPDPAKERAPELDASLYYWRPTFWRRRLRSG